MHLPARLAQKPDTAIITTCWYIFKTMLCSIYDFIFWHFWLYDYLCVDQVSPVEESDAGHYKCTAVNRVGQGDPSPRIHVQVKGKQLFSVSFSP